VWKLKSIRNFLLSLVVFLCLASPVFAQEGSSDLEEFQKTALELSNKSNNSQSKSEDSSQSYKPELSSVNNSKDSLTQSELESMNPFELLDLLETKLDKAQRNYEAAVKSSMSFEEGLFNTKIELENSKKTLKELKQALLSNKEDTSVVVAELGELYEKVKRLNELIASYEKMKKRLRTTAYVELGIGVPCLVLGLLPIWTDEQKNIQNLLLGIGGTATAAGGFTFVFTITF
jgi:superfamily I DNA and/or RNA helicase